MFFGILKFWWVNGNVFYRYRGSISRYGKSVLLLIVEFLGGLVVLFFGMKK